MENWVFNQDYFENWKEDYLDLLEEVNQEYSTIKAEEE